MVVKIKSFAFARHFYQKIGIYPPKSNQCLFNWKNVLLILIIIHGSVSLGAYFVFRAERLDEMGLTFYGSVTMAGTACGFVLMIWQNGKTLKLIEQYDDLIEQSELTTFTYNYYYYFKN